MGYKECLNAFCNPFNGMGKKQYTFKGDVSIMFNKNSAFVINEEYDIQISCSFVETKKSKREFVVTLNRPRLDEEVSKNRHRKSMRKKMLQQLRISANTGDLLLQNKIFNWLKDMRKVGFSKMGQDDLLALTLEVFEELINLKES